MGVLPRLLDLGMNTEERMMFCDFKPQRYGDSEGNFQVSSENLGEPPHFIYEENEAQGDVTFPLSHCW